MSNRQIVDFNHPSNIVGIIMKLKYTLAIVAFIVAGFNPVQAQFGIRGGINLADFFTEGDVETNGSTGLNLGAAFTLIKLGPINLVAEGYYAEKGTGQDVIGLNPENLLGLENPEELERLLENGGTLEYGLDYVEVPVLARINLPVQGGVLRPYLNAGPAFSWQINCGVKVDVASESSNFECSDLQRENLQETIQDYEMGMIIGGGLDLPIFELGAGLNLDIRYNRGLSRLTRVDENGVVKNSAWTMMLGYFFGL